MSRSYYLAAVILLSCTIWVQILILSDQRRKKKNKGPILTLKVTLDSLPFYAQVSSLKVSTSYLF